MNLFENQAIACGNDKGGDIPAYTGVDKFSSKVVRGSVVMTTGTINGGCVFILPDDQLTSIELDTEPKTFRLGGFVEILPGTLRQA